MNDVKRKTFFLPGDFELLRETSDSLPGARCCYADRKALDALNSEKRELELKLKDIDRKIDDAESRIKKERLYIAENKR
ncbi:MAG: hypothetical protein EOM14_16150 [Clostridia bacterium]|nr:hypothetical protein [Clostridia bacterium]